MPIKRFSTLLFFLYVVPVALLVAFDYVQNVNAQIEDRKDSLEALANIQAKNTERLVEQLSHQLSLVASRTKMRELLASLNEENQREHSIRIKAIIDDAAAQSDNINGITVFPRNSSSPINSVFATVPPAEDSLPVAANPFGLISVNRLTDGNISLDFEAALMHHGERVGSVRANMQGRLLRAIILESVGLGYTGETLLGMLLPNQDAVFLTPIRTRPDAALRERVSASSKDVPMIRVLNGYSDPAMQLVDFKGVPVFAAAAAIPSLGWGLVVKTDKKEALAGLVERSVSFLFVALILGIAITSTVAKMIFSRLREVSDITENYFEENPELHQYLGEKRSWAYVDEVSSLLARVVALINFSRDANENLAEKVEFRTREIATLNNELQAAQEGLIHNARLAAVGELATSVAHEINQPLTALQMKYERVGRQIDNQDFAAASESVAETPELIERIRFTVDGLRNLGRKPKDRPLRTLLNDCVTNAVRVMADQMSRDEVQVSSQINAGEVWVVAEGNEIEQVLINLISNARDALDAIEGKQILISLDADDDKAYVRVEDNGQGVPSHLVDTIFDGYFSTKKISGGVGLGLTISQKIIEAAGGTIAVESSEAGRTVILVSLPRAATQEQD